MVVCVIIGVVSSVVVAEMRGSFQDVLLRSTGRRLIDGFAIAYSRAVSLNRTHRVKFDRARSRFVIEEQTRGGAKGETFAPVRDLPGGDGSLDARISVQFHKSNDSTPGESASENSAASRDDLKTSAPEEDVSFYADGTADAAEVLLRDHEGFRLALRVNPITSRVRLVELDRK
jgi:Tfp pilus assembly protein FimT